jgi:hypothetical protein
MPYAIDLDKISVSEYETLLKKANLLPGRKILLKNIASNFAAIRGKGIQSAGELKRAISTKRKLAAFAVESGIPEEYLVVLRREIGSMEAKNIPLSNFPNIDEHLLLTLEAKGIRSAKEYLERARGTSAELDALCDLARINGVGAQAARAFYEAGYRCSRDVANADAHDMLTRVGSVNAEERYYSARLGEKDMQFCIDSARLLVRFENKSGL